MTGIKILKYTIIAINVIILASGLIMLISGSVVQGSINNQKLAHTIGGYSLQAGSIICIIFGIVVFVMALVGLWATSKDMDAVLIVFGVIMSLVFLIQFITGATGLGVKNNSSFNKYVDDTFANEFKYNTTYAEERDFYQRFFKCCGWNGFQDYMNENNTVTTLLAPESCCIKEKCDTTRPDEVFRNGCNIKLYDAARYVIEVACSILVVFSMFTLLSVILSCILSRKIKKGYQYS